MNILRQDEIDQIKQQFKVTPTVAIIGPRQCGKTTLAHQFISTLKDEVHYFDLENPRDLARLENAMLTLENLEGLVVIDEVQRRPELFPILRVLIDKKNRSVKYLILGSASGHLLKQSSESLAGRISYLEMMGFSLQHISMSHQQKLWLRGGFPNSFLAKKESISYNWRLNFIKTFLENDIPNLGIQIPAPSLRRFWMMISHYHGQVFNASEIGRSLNISDHTARRYLDLLSATFLIRQIQPWYYNTKKRLVKRPKIYLRDSGILHALSSIETSKQLSNHPKVGASWEGFALDQSIQHLKLKEQDLFFWGVHTGGELDLLFQKKGKFWGIEVKYCDTPKITPSMKSAISDLSLAHLWVIHPGKDCFPMDKKITAVPISKLREISP